MNRTLRCVATVALVLFAGAPLMSSCSQQAEAERCELDKGATGADSDCADGLRCTDPATLQHTPAAALCCPIDGTFTTLGCTPKQPSAATTSTTTSTTTSGAGGTAGTGGAATSASSSSAHASGGAGGGGGT